MLSLCVLTMVAQVLTTIHRPTQTSDELCSQTKKLYQSDLAYWVYRSCAGAAIRVSLSMGCLLNRWNDNFMKCDLWSTDLACTSYLLSLFRSKQQKLWSNLLKCHMEVINERMTFWATLVKGRQCLCVEIAACKTTFSWNMWREVKTADNVNTVFLTALHFSVVLMHILWNWQIDQDRSDERLYRPNRRCEITKYMELAWAAKMHGR